MAKKKIIGKTKLTQEKILTPQLNIIKAKPKIAAKSFRLHDKDIMNLKTITAELNTISQKKISETQVIGGLIEIGSKTKTEKLLKVIKKRLSNI